MTDGHRTRQEHVATERDALADIDPASGRDRPFLVIRVDDAVRTIEIEEGAELLVGRLEDAEVSVQHPSVSRRHALIRSTGGVLSVEDLGTVNGTRVNRVPLLATTQAIFPGDLVSIGPAEIAVALTAQPHRKGAVLGSGRLDREILRAEAEKAALFLVRFEAAVAAQATPLLDDAIATDTVGRRELLALLAPAACDELRARLATTPALARSVGFARFPADGATIAALLEHARAGVDEEPFEASEGVLAVDPASIKVFQRARRVAATSVNVLVVGETGVGKELVAEVLHARSPRRDRPFVRLNCGAIPDALLESELFGHEKGAFTGATRRKIGYFEAAQDGTLLLDEIGELTLSLQPKLLRVLESRKVTRIGSTDEIPIEARLVFSTHRDLKAEVGRGRFREDLYYRISTFTIVVPPLRERPIEIAPLAEVFARRFAATMGAPVPAFDATALTAMRSYPWPGNVRELRNAVEHALVMAEGGVVHARDLPDAIAAGPHEIRGRAIRGDLESMERERIEHALAAESGNRTYAARRLGVSRRALLYKIAKYGLGART